MFTSFKLEKIIPILIPFDFQIYVSSLALFNSRLLSLFVYSNLHSFIQQIFTEYQSKQGTVLGTGDTRMGTGMTVCLCVLTHVCACVCVCVCIHIQLNKLKLHIIAF